MAKRLRLVKQSDRERDRMFSGVPELRPGMTFREFGTLMLRGLRWPMFLTLLGVTLAECIDLGTIYLTKLVVDMLAGASSPAALSYNTVLFMVGGIAVLAFVQSLMWRVAGYFASHYSMAFEVKVQQALFRYLSQHNPGYFFNHFAGALATKVRNVSSGYFELLDAVHWTLIGGIVSFLGAFLLFTGVHPVLFVILAVWISCFALTYRFLGPKKRIYSRARATEESKKTGRLVDAITNMQTITLFARQKEEARHLWRYMYKTFDISRASWRYTDLMAFANGNISLTARVILFVTAAHLWFQGVASTGDLVMIFSIAGTLSSTLRQFGNVMNRLYSSIGSVQEGLEVLLVPHGILDAPGARPLEVTKSKIEFRKVGFAYPGRESVLENFSLTIKPGEKVGLVGRSGAGKTTLVSLLLRFYDVTSGSISIDGQDLSLVQQATLREQVSVVPQEPLLFHRTLMENIRYGREDATDEEVREAARLALAHDFITALPEGYNTKVGERGVKLSGGQRQRVAIARAILKDAPILVLDEATASLDSESEVAISEALHNLVRDKTVIAIAHRLSTLREMTRIVVMDGGKIVEDGSHEELLTRNGIYAGLWQTQAGGFLQE